jgi:flagellar operon protein
MGISELYRNLVTPTGAPEIKPQTNNPAKNIPPNEFANVLKKEQSSDLTLSQHAQTRIKSRQIPWNDAIFNRIKEGVQTAESKGSKEALILADNIAVIANVKSKTIVTAMDSSQLKGRVFTNIDSAVLV